MSYIKNILLFFLYINTFISKANIDFLIIGAQKSGTTSLFYYLSQHPQISMPQCKEVDFFTYHFEKGLNWYYSQFFKKQSEKIKLGEATPNYLFDPIVPKRVFELFPKIKLIIILRNPVDRAFSQYKHNLKAGRERLIDSFELALDRDLFIHLDMSKKYELPISYSKFSFTYISRGIYIDQIKRWMDFFPRHQFLIILFDDLISNPENSVNQICDFLNISRLKLDKYEKFNENEDFRHLNMKPETKQNLYNFYLKYNKDLESYLNIKLPW